MQAERDEMKEKQKAEKKAAGGDDDDEDDVHPPTLNPGPCTLDPRP